MIFVDAKATHFNFGQFCSVSSPHANQYEQFYYFPLTLIKLINYRTDIKDFMFFLVSLELCVIAKTKLLWTGEKL